MRRQGRRVVAVARRVIDWGAGDALVTATFTAMFALLNGGGGGVAMGAVNQRTAGASIVTVYAVTDPDAQEVPLTRRNQNQTGVPTSTAIPTTDTSEDYNNGGWWFSSTSPSISTTTGSASTTARRATGIGAPTVPCVRMNDVLWEYRRDATTRTDVKALFAIFYSLIIVFGVGGNLCVILSIARTRSLQTVPNMFIFSLSCSDIVVCCTSATITPITAFEKEWLFGGFLCSVAPFIAGVSLCFSTFTLAAISLDRFMLIRFPMKKPFSHAQALFLIFLICVLAMGLSMPIMFMQTLRPIDKYCGQFCYEDWGANQSQRRAYGTLMLTLQFIIPLSVIIFCYTAISVRLAQSVILKSKHYGSGAMGGRGNCAAYHWQMQMTDQQRAATKRRQRTNRMFIAMVVAFSASWIWTLMFNLLRDYEILPEFVKKQEFFFGITTHCIAMTSTVWNPLLYALLNLQLRAAFVQLMPKFFKECLIHRHLSAKKRRAGVGGTTKNNRSNSGGGGAEARGGRGDGRSSKSQNSTLVGGGCAGGTVPLLSSLGGSGGGGELSSGAVDPHMYVNGRCIDVADAVYVGGESLSRSGIGSRRKIVDGENGGSDRLPSLSVRVGAASSVVQASAVASPVPDDDAPSTPNCRRFDTAIMDGVILDEEEDDMRLLRLSSAITPITCVAINSAVQQQQQRGSVEVDDDASACRGLTTTGDALPKYGSFDRARVPYSPFGHHFFPLRSSPSSFGALDGGDRNGVVKQHQLLLLSNSNCTSPTANSNNNVVDGTRIVRNAEFSPLPPYSYHHCNNNNNWPSTAIFVDRNEHNNTTQRSSSSPYHVVMRHQSAAVDVPTASPNAADSAQRWRTPPSSTALSSGTGAVVTQGMRLRRAATVDYGDHYTDGSHRCQQRPPVNGAAATGRDGVASSQFLDDRLASLAGPTHIYYQRMRLLSAANVATSGSGRLAWRQRSVGHRVESSERRPLLWHGEGAAGRGHVGFVNADRIYKPLADYATSCGTDTSIDNDQRRSASASLLITGREVSEQECGHGPPPIPTSTGISLSQRLRQRCRSTRGGGRTQTVDERTNQPRRFSGVVAEEQHTDNITNRSPTTTTTIYRRRSESNRRNNNVGQTSATKFDDDSGFFSGCSTGGGGGGVVSLKAEDNAGGKVARRLRREQSVPVYDQQQQKHGSICQQRLLLSLWRRGKRNSAGIPLLWGGDGSFTESVRRQSYGTLPDTPRSRQRRSASAAQATTKCTASAAVTASAAATPTAAAEVERLFGGTGNRMEATGVSRAFSFRCGDASTERRTRGVYCAECRHNSATDDCVRNGCDCCAAVTTTAFMDRRTALAASESSTSWSSASSSSLDAENAMLWNGLKGRTMWVNDEAGYVRRGWAAKRSAFRSTLSQPEPQQPMVITVTLSNNVHDQQRHIDKSVTPTEKKKKSASLRVAGGSTARRRAMMRRWIHRFSVDRQCRDEGGGGVVAEPSVIGAGKQLLSQQQQQQCRPLITAAEEGVENMMTVVKDVKLSDAAGGRCAANALAIVEDVSSHVVSPSPSTSPVLAHLADV